MWPGSIQDAKVFPNSGIHKKLRDGELPIFWQTLTNQTTKIPNYLIEKKIPENFTNLIIRKSLYFTRQVMLNKFFIPNNLIFPKSRMILENYFN